MSDYTPQFRLRVIQAWKDSKDESLPSVAARFGVPVQTAKTWAKEYKAGRLQAAADGSQGERKPHRLPGPAAPTTAPLTLTLPPPRWPEPSSEAIDAMVWEEIAGLFDALKFLRLSLQTDTWLGGGGHTPAALATLYKTLSDNLGRYLSALRISEAEALAQLASGRDSAAPGGATGAPEAPGGLLGHLDIQGREGDG